MKLIQFFSRQSENDEGECGDGSGGGGGSTVILNGNDSTNNNMDVIFLGRNGINNQKDVKREVTTQNQFSNKYSSCKTLQRKLELKVERAKRNYSQQNRNEVITVCN